MVKSENLCADVYRARFEQLFRIARALATNASVKTMAALVGEECRQEMKSDSVCVHLLQPDNMYELAYEVGCSEGFKTQWKRVPVSIFPEEVRTSPKTFVFFGTAAELKKEIPCTAELVDRSPRKTIAFAPLVVGDVTIGMIGFAYNTEQKFSPDHSFLLVLMNLCAQALDRARLAEIEASLLHRAEAANQAKTEFLANINHEIRTPLSVIGGFSELLCEASNLTDQQMHWAATIRRNAGHVTRLVGEVLDISKIEADKLELETTEFSFLELFSDVETSLRLTAQLNGTTLKFENKSQIDRVLSDPTRVKQILMNVIGNAIKFTARGEVSVRSVSQGDRVQVVIQDTGIGISTEDQTRIFEPFQQSDSSMHRRFGGTGLGLPIARRLARALGGDIQILESELGVGSKFLVTLHMRTIPPFPLNLPKAKSSVDQKRLSKVRLLLVDDSADSRELIRFFLESDGAQVTAASSGAEALSLTLTNHFDMVLLDIQMPGMDGYETIAEFQRRQYSGKIVALTAHALGTEKVRAIRSGFADYITKPVHRTTLAEKILNVIGSEVTPTPHSSFQHQKSL